MSIWQRIAEDKIQTAMQAGELDNLPGRGRPLRLDDLDLVPEDQRMAYSLLHSNQLTPAWLERSKEIDSALEDLRRDTRRALAGLPDDPARAALRAAFGQAVRRLNRQILSYNVQAPSPALQRRALLPEAEWEALLKRA